MGFGGSTNAFRFAYQSLVGNGSIVAQITSQSNASASAVSGVMIRESLFSDSRYVALVLTPSSRGTFGYRRVSHNTPFQSPLQAAPANG